MIGLNARGLWIASGGTALQLIGLGWDALLHRLDPTLAEREQVISLANPSHLMIVGGLGITALGLVLMLFGLGRERRPEGGLRRGPLIGASALFTLLAGLITVGIATGGLEAGHRHQAIGSDGAAAIAGLAGQPTFVALQATLRTGGTAAALDQLEALAAGDDKVLLVAHEYAHAIGRLSLDQYGGVNQAFGRCRESFQSGCYHGVLEAHLERNPQLTPAEIGGLCDGSVAPGASNTVRFQCLHGLGHGLTGNSQHDIFRALRLCDALPTDWDRGSCYGGVFMENIIFATHQLEVASGGTGHDHGGGHRAYLDPADPLYPCNVVDDRYKSECFVMQTSAILLFNGHSFERALSECDRAPGDYVHLCYQSIGRDISSDSYRDPLVVKRVCLQGQPAFRGNCFLGAAKHMIDVTWRTDQALELCQLAPPGSKELCYTAIGEQLANLYPEPERRADECARAEREYRLVCAEGAGLAPAGFGQLTVTDRERA